MTPTDRMGDLLLHMIVSCNRLPELQKTTSQIEFKSNYRVHELALRFIESLGEAARRIDRLDPQWFDHVGLEVARQVIGMRNRIAHQYDGVDLDLVWQVVVDYAPRLRDAAIPILLQLRPNADPDSLHF